MKRQQTLAHPHLETTFTQLPNLFFSSVAPTPMAQPETLLRNDRLAKELGIDNSWLSSDDAAQVLSGNRPLNTPASIASAYAGHQFGHLNPQLGDGRAHLLGEIISPQQQRFDIQLKGSGPTPYSRQGDGRSPLGPVLREYIVSEAMHALGVPTSRSLAAIATGETVWRNQTKEPGAILTRVAKSHIRVGSFTFAALHGEDNTQALADYCLTRHFPDLPKQQLPYLNLLQKVIELQANLIAKWMSLGFVHGVMNTDNMLICGQTIDYGPCAFLDTYIADKAFSFIDREGRYRYNNQPAIGQWNLVRFAEALLPIMGDSTESALPIVQDALNDYQQQYTQAFNHLMANKIGLSEATQKSVTLVTDLLAIMSADKLDFTLTFRYLMTQIKPPENSAPDTSHSDNTDTDNLTDLTTQIGFATTTSSKALAKWIQSWLPIVNNEPTAIQLMANNNPIFIPRNHLIEGAIQAAYQGDMAPTKTLLEATGLPYRYRSDLAYLATPPTPEEMVANTFCGT